MQFELNAAPPNGTYRTAGESNAILRPHWRAGYLAITIIPKIGPDVGTQIISLTPRRSFKRTVRDFGRKLRLVGVYKYSDGLIAIRGPSALKQSIGAGVRRGLVDVSQQDTNFYNDVALLGALHFLCGDAILEESGSGVAMLGLAADPDESLPWQQRGLPDQTFLKRFAHPSLVASRRQCDA